MLRVQSIFIPAYKLQVFCFSTFVPAATGLFMVIALLVGLVVVSVYLLDFKIMMRLLATTCLGRKTMLMVCELIFTQNYVLCGSCFEKGKADLCRLLMEAVDISW